MEEPQEILLNSLANAGVPIPAEVSSVMDLTPETLFSICAHSLRIISNSESFPIILPDSMADRFKICADIAASVKDLGYIGDISFHKFLYPSEEDMYKLIRFLVGRLSESFGTPYNRKDNNATTNIEISGTSSDKPAYITDEERRDLDTKVENLKLATKEAVSNSIQHVKQEIAIDGNPGGTWENSRSGSHAMANGLIKGSRDTGNCADGNQGTASQEDGQCEPEHEQISNRENSSEMSDKSLLNQENVLSEEVTTESVELQKVQEQHDLLKAALEMACNEQNSSDSYISQLSEQIDTRRRNLAELESKWNVVIKPLEEKKTSLQEALCAERPESQEKLQKWKELDRDLESISSETKQREDELLKLEKEVEKLPKSASRRSYVERIKEITKNSRKQDTDIERILKETRELQVESNAIQERLHRTYAVLDETMLRETKKGLGGQQAHKLLTVIHESFEEISEKILATDRARREATDLEAKLSGIASRSLNIDKLQADLDAIRKENELLQLRFG